MSGTPVVMTLASTLVTVILSVLVAEAAGYLLHRLMHSERIPALSRAHLIHHLLMYGPHQPMRTEPNTSTPRTGVPPWATSASSGSFLPR